MTKSKPDTILDAGPTVDIQGTTYTIRRLGFQDVFKVARILGRGVAVLGDQGSELTPGQILQVIIASMTTNEQEVIDLLASLIGETRESITDPERFPMDSMVDIIKVLAEHQDLRAFLAKVQAMTETLPEMQTAMKTG
jgi:hypothetical protein